MNQEVVFVNDADAANGDSSSSDEQVFVDSGPDADDVSEGAGPESRGSGAAAEKDDAGDDHTTLGMRAACDKESIV